MVVAAIKALKERTGSSRQAILKYIMSNYNVGKDEKSVNTHLKVCVSTAYTGSGFTLPLQLLSSPSCSVGNKPRLPQFSSFDANLVIFPTIFDQRE
jgi:hypothetical protein